MHFAANERIERIERINQHALFCVLCVPSRPKEHGRPADVFFITGETPVLPHAPRAVSRTDSSSLSIFTLQISGSRPAQPEDATLERGAPSEDRREYWEQKVSTLWRQCTANYGLGAERDAGATLSTQRVDFSAPKNVNALRTQLRWRISVYLHLFHLRSFAAKLALASRPCIHNPGQKAPPRKPTVPRSRSRLTLRPASDKVGKCKGQ